MLTRHQIEELLSESDSEAEERKLDHESSLEDFEILSDEGSVTYIGISEGESICSDAQPFSVPPQEEDPSSGFLSKNKKLFGTTNVSAHWLVGKGMKTLLRLLQDQLNMPLHVLLISNLHLSCL